MCTRKYFICVDEMHADAHTNSFVMTQLHHTYIHIRVYV
jgi:hypothetical protein